LKKALMEVAGLYRRCRCTASDAMTRSSGHMAQIAPNSSDAAPQALSCSRSLAQGAGCFSNPAGAAAKADLTLVE
jgi:hypothetical protein